MKNLFNIFSGGHKPDAEALSAYLDRRLTANEHAAVEAHVASCAACRTQLAGLQDVRATLRAMPPAETPRSFRVRQADVDVAGRPARAAAAPWTRALPAFGGLAAAVFVVAIAVDVRGSGSGSDETIGMRVSSESDFATAPTGGIAADAGAERTTSSGAPAPVAPEDSPGEAKDGDNAGTGVATSSPSELDDMELNAGADASPDVEAARDATFSEDDGGWPLARYIAIVAAISALAALGAWLGFTLERRSS